MQPNIKSKTVNNVVRFGKDRKDVVGCAIWLRTCLASLRASWLAWLQLESLRPSAYRMPAMAMASRSHSQRAFARLRGERSQRTPRSATAPDIG